jgi:hypothetical protein
VICPVTNTPHSPASRLLQIAVISEPVERTNAFAGKRASSRMRA